VSTKAGTVHDVALIILGIALIAMLVWRIRKHRADSSNETTPTT